MIWRILCESADLAVQCLAAATQVGLEVAPSVEQEPLLVAARSMAHDEAIAVALSTAPSLDAIVELASAARGRAFTLILALPVPHATRATLLDELRRAEMLGLPGPAPARRKKIVQRLYRMTRE